MLTLRRLFGAAYLVILFSFSRAWGQSSGASNEVKLPPPGHRSFTIGFEYGYAAAFQNRASSPYGSIGKGNPFADAYGGINLRYKIGPILFETAYLHHRMWMTYDVSDTALRQGNSRRQFSDASLYREIPLRLGYEFRIGKRKRSYFVPLIGTSFIWTSKSDYVLGSRSTSNTLIKVGTGDSIFTITESQFYRSRTRVWGLNIGAQLGYQYKHHTIQLQSGFVYNPKDWIYGEIRYQRHSDQKGSFFDQGFVYWKMAIWSASLSYRYVIFR